MVRARAEVEHGIFADSIFAGGTIRRVYGIAGIFANSVARTRSPVGLSLSLPESAWRNRSTSRDGLL